MSRPNRTVLDLARLEAIRRVRYERKSNYKNKKEAYFSYARETIERVLSARGCNTGIDIGGGGVPTFSEAMQELIVMLAAEVMKVAMKLEPGGYYVNCRICDGDGEIEVTVEKQGEKRKRKEKVLTDCPECYGSGDVFSSTPVGASR